jgi:hypothetical protein
MKTIEEALKIFIRFAYCKSTEWLCEGDVIYDEKLGMKFDLEGALAIAEKLLHTNTKEWEIASALNPTTIILTPDVDMKGVKGFLVLDVDNNVMGYAQIPEGQISTEVSNLPEGKYRILTIDDNKDIVKVDNTGVEIVKEVPDKLIP